MCYFRLPLVLLLLSEVRQQLLHEVGVDGFALNSKEALVSCIYCMKISCVACNLCKTSAHHENSGGDSLLITIGSDV